MILFDQPQQPMERKSVRFPPGLWAEVMAFAKVNEVDESAAVRALVRTALHLPQEKKGRGR